MEKLGIERSRRALASSAAALLVLDGSVAPTSDDLEIARSIAARLPDTPTGRAGVAVVINKSDLPEFKAASCCNEELQAINVSARTGEGLAALRAAILSSLNSNGSDQGSLLITNARHYDLLCNPQREIEVARTALRDRHSEELVLAPLHNALRFLGQITGETTTEDILSEIFATFCIGK